LFDPAYGEFGRKTSIGGLIANEQSLPVQSRFIIFLSVCDWIDSRQKFVSLKRKGFSSPYLSSVHAKLKSLLHNPNRLRRGRRSGSDADNWASVEAFGECTMPALGVRRAKAALSSG
jgi:hypothetical protein